MKDLILRRNALLRSVPRWRRIRMFNGEPVDPYQILRRFFRWMAPFVVGALAAGFAVSGYWWAADIGSDRDLARIVREVLPQPSTWAEAELRNRMPVRQKAIELFETAITAPTSPLPSEVGKLIGVNTERAQWLRAEALGFMAEHLSQMAEAEKKYKLDRLIAVSQMVGDPAIFSGLALLARLSPDERLAMFGSDAQGLQLFISKSRDLLSQKDRVGALRDSLEKVKVDTEAEITRLNSVLAKHGCESQILKRVFTTIQQPGFSCTNMDQLPRLIESPKKRAR